MRINWKFLFTALIVLAVLGITAWMIRGWLRSQKLAASLRDGLAAYDAGQWEQAARGLGRYIVSYPDNVDVLVKYANANLNIRPSRIYYIEQAATAYRNALRLDSSNAEAARKLIATYLAMNMAAEAQAVAENRLSVVDDPETRIMLGAAYAAQRRFTEAKAELMTIIDKQPQMVSAYEYLAAILDSSNPEAANKTLDDCVIKNADSPLAYIVRASYALSKYDNASAIKDLTLAETKGVSDPAVQLRMAKSWLDAGRPQEAQRYVKELVLKDQSNAEAWLTYASVAEATGSKELMIQVADEGLRSLGDKDSEFIVSAARLYIQADRLDSALECASKLEVLQTDPAGVYFIRGLVYDRRGEQNQAIKQWRQSLALMGRYGIRSHLGIAMASAAMDDLNSALRQLRGALLQYPDSFDIRIGYARLLNLAGQSEAAAEQARAALRINPTSVEAARQLLDAQIALVTPKTSDLQTSNLRKQLADLSGKLSPDIIRLMESELETRLGNISRASSILKNLQNGLPESSVVGFREASLLALQGKRQEAVEKLKQLLKQRPNDRDTLELLARLYIEDGQGSEVDTWLEKAISSTDKSSDRLGLMLLQAAVYQQSGRLELNYKLLRELDADYPDDIRVKRCLLSITSVFNNHSEAQKLIDAIRKTEGEDGWQWRYEQARLWVFGSEKDLAVQAIKLLKDNLRANPDDLNSLLLLGAAFEKTGQNHLALNTYTELLATHPDETRAVIAAAMALYAAGSYDRANQILERIDADKLKDSVFTQIRLRGSLEKNDLAGAGKIIEERLIGDPNDLGMRLALAQIKTRQMDLAGAAVILETIRNQNPSSIEAVAGLVNIRIIQKDRDGAMSLCNEYLGQWKNPEGYILRAKTHQAFGMNEESLRDVDAAIGMAPDSAMTWLAASQILSKSGQLQRAYEAMSRAVEIAPLNLDIGKRAIEMFTSSPDKVLVRRGEEILNRLYEANSDDIELRFLKARSLAARGTRKDIVEGIAILDKILAERPGIEGAYILLTRLWLARNDAQKALDTASLGLAFHPGSKTLLSLKAEIEVQTSASRALSTLQTLHEMDPCDTGVLMRLADALVNTGKTEAAIQALESGLKSEKAVDRLRIGRQLMNIYVKNNRYDSAERVASLFADQEPAGSLARAYFLMAKSDWKGMSELLGRLHIANDKTSIAAIAGELAGRNETEAMQLAEAELEYIISEQPGNADAVMSLAMLYQKQGRTDKARQMYEKVLALSPDNLAAANNLAWILCHDMNDPQAALAIAQKGLEIMPSYIDLIDTRGAAYYKSGKLSEAYDDFKTCVEMYAPSSPGLPTACLHLAKVCLDLGRGNEARENITRARQIDRLLRVLTPEQHSELNSIEASINSLR